MPNQRSSKTSAAGVGVALDPRPGSKVFKVRLYHKGSVLNLGRFETAHTARLAYDQAVASLSGTRKCIKTNYPEGTYELYRGGRDFNEDVQSKVEAFLALLAQRHSETDDASDGAAPAATAAAAACATPTHATAAYDVTAGQGSRDQGGSPTAVISRALSDHAVSACAVASAPAGGDTAAAAWSAAAVWSAAAANLAEHSLQQTCQRAESMYTADTAVTRQTSNTMSTTQAAGAPGALQQRASGVHGFEDDKDFQQLLAMVPSLSLSLLHGSELERILQPQQQQQPKQMALALPQQVLQQQPRGILPSQQQLMLPTLMQPQQLLLQQHALGNAAAAVQSAAPTAAAGNIRCHGCASSNCQAAVPAVAEVATSVAAAAAVGPDLGPFELSQWQQGQLLQQQHQQQLLLLPASTFNDGFTNMQRTPTSSSQLQSLASRFNSLQSSSTVIAHDVAAGQCSTPPATPAAAAFHQPYGFCQDSQRVLPTYAGSPKQSTAGGFDCFKMAAAAASNAAAAMLGAASEGFPDSPWVQMATMQPNSVCVHQQ